MVQLTHEFIDGCKLIGAGCATVGVIGAGVGIVQYLVTLLLLMLEILI